MVICITDFRLKFFFDELHLTKSIGIDMIRKKVMIYEKHTQKNAFIAVEAESVMECGDCGGMRKVATDHNPS